MIYFIYHLFQILTPTFSSQQSEAATALLLVTKPAHDIHIPFVPLLMLNSCPPTNNFLLQFSYSHARKDYINNTSSSKLTASVV